MPNQALLSWGAAACWRRKARSPPPDTNSPANNAYYRAASCRYCKNPTRRGKDSSRGILLAIASIVLIHSDFESILRWICDGRGSSDHGYVRSGMIIMTAWNNADLRLRNLWVLSVVLRDHNLTSAAELLDTTQPSISKILARLREHFGDPLFIRYGNVMHPTPQALEIPPPLISRIAGEGSKLSLHAVPLDSRHFESKLESGEADLALGAFSKAPRGLRRQRLYFSGYLSVARKDHPKAATLRTRSGFR